MGLYLAQARFVSIYFINSYDITWYYLISLLLIEPNAVPVKYETKRDLPKTKFDKNSPAILIQGLHEMAYIFPRKQF